MSESSYKLTTFSRRQPPDSRQLPKVKKSVHPQKVVKKQVHRESTKKTSSLVRTKVSPNVISTTTVNQRRVVPQTKTTTVKGIPPLNPSTQKIKTVRIPKQDVINRNKRSRKTRLKPMARTILYGLRLLIVGVGIGAIVGTVLSVLDPATRLNPVGVSNTSVGQTQSQPNPVQNSTFSLTQEIISLKSTVQNLAAQTPSLTPGVFLVDLESGGYVDINAAATFPAASTIKFPILVAFFQEVDQGKIRLDEMLTMEQQAIAGGSGDMQYKKIGTQFSALEVATKMMTISDNTATNMLITRLGGIEALNQRFRTWGLTTTFIRNPLPDLSGTNTTSPKELGNLMGMVSKGNLLSMPSRDRLLEIMRRTVRDTLLPSGLGAGATIAHKTGDIAPMLADTGLIDLPTGKRYIVAVMVQRPNNDTQAEKLIGSISRAAYQQFSQNGTGTIPPTTNIQSPVIAPIPNTGVNTVPNTNYQPSLITPVPNSMGSIPMNSYQPPIINSVPNAVNSVPGYQPPITTTPQYYYQR